MYALFLPFLYIIVAQFLCCCSYGDHIKSVPSSIHAHNALQIVHMVITLNQKQPIYTDVIQLTAALVKYVCRFNEPTYPGSSPCFMCSPHFLHGRSLGMRLALIRFGWVLIWLATWSCFQAFPLSMQCSLSLKFWMRKFNECRYNASRGVYSLAQPLPAKKKRGEAGPVRRFGRWSYIQQLDDLWSIHWRWGGWWRLPISKYFETGSVGHNMNQLQSNLASAWSRRLFTFLAWRGIALMSKIRRHLGSKLAPSLHPLLSYIAAPVGVEISIPLLVSAANCMCFSQPYPGVGWLWLVSGWLTIRLWSKKLQGPQ